MEEETDNEGTEKDKVLLPPTGSRVCRRRKGEIGRETLEQDKVSWTTV